MGSSSEGAPSVVRAAAATTALTIPTSAAFPTLCTTCLFPALTCKADGSLEKA